jgi:hypothetical protein
MASHIAHEDEYQSGGVLWRWPSLGLLAVSLKQSIASAMPGPGIAGCFPRALPIVRSPVHRPGVT